MTDYRLEVDEKQATELVKAGADVYIFWRDASDIEFVQETLHAAPGTVHDIDMSEAGKILMNLGNEGEMRQAGKEYEGSVIVCPHGNTSKRFAEALKALGIRAYSLRKGVAGLKERA